MNFDTFCETFAKVAENCLPPVLQERVSSTTLIPVDHMPPQLEPDLCTPTEPHESGVMVKVRRGRPGVPPASDAAIYEAYAHKELAPKNAFVLPLLGACQGSTTGNVYLFTPLLQGDIIRVNAQNSFQCSSGELVLKEMATSLKVLHDAGLVHGDIKEQNFFVGRDGHIVIADFGALGQPGWSPEAGTLGYIAPERLVVNNANSFASDIWALGVAFKNVLSALRATVGSSWGALFELSNRMTASDPAARPSVDDVLLDPCLCTLGRLESQGAAPLAPDASGYYGLSGVTNTSD
ncbi:unnamed protein product [Neospora caninum Liverpool]|uniref:Rhoptry kinase family protein ROP46, putative n=1 Tax=Neospora caninum (strain Liverpool) TaxID=572307 RepID=F0VHV1_NEOCL|nr:uncharacterized protein NCLIV_030990 [Neospora caninum Liverpool]CBZ53312.1 unnamed protein product [Neospora caninum Liverpool]CEL67298.1 TPA: Rhoptry kinase family protein ROP46, putative [Neospora caninum Liverpool]|eukprot:XP_003883344.1 uncharacterized protein NCLIV_030990 [Neospora caninum Liverpool]